MKKIKVSETTNLQLNWLVAKCEGQDAESFPDLLKSNFPDMKVRSTT